MALVGLGFRALSMAPPCVGPVKAMVRGLDVGRLSEFVRGLTRLPAHSVREAMRAFARDHDVAV
ncbi:MAG: hypothetical protein ACT4N4_10610, partial [Rhodospirillales bacterium]